MTILAVSDPHGLTPWHRAPSLAIVWATARAQAAAVRYGLNLVAEHCTAINSAVRPRPDRARAMRLPHPPLWGHGDVQFTGRNPPLARTPATPRRKSRRPPHPKEPAPQSIHHGSA